MKKIQYSVSLATLILSKVAEGMYLEDIAVSSATFPDTATIYRWFKKFPEFRREYERVVAIRNSLQKNDTNA